MKRNKKLLLSFLALNAVLTFYAGAASNQGNVKYNRLYNNIIKNIENGNSNNSNYKTIEQILNKKNKELKDLYLQNDYVVKPEYLEWQVLSSGFYTKRTRGDNTLDNAKYYSVLETYSGKKTYNESAFDKLYADLRATNLLTDEQLSAILAGHYNVINSLSLKDQKIVRNILNEGLSNVSKTDGFKTYANPQNTKEIDLGINIPPKVVNREPLNPNPTIPTAPTFNPPDFNPTVPAAPVVPALTIKAFNPVSPEVTEPELATAPIFNIKLGSYCNGMRGCGDGINGGGFGIGTARSYLAGDDITGVINGDSSLRYSWSFTDSKLLRVYFDLIEGSQGGISILGADLTIDSINPLNLAQKENETNALRNWNSQVFLVGGSRVATIDNVYEATLTSRGVINLVGPLVVGFEIQSDNLNSTLPVTMINKGIITDDGEVDSPALDGVIAKGGNPISLNLGPSNEGSITVKRDSEGYTGYKVGLILTYENNASRLYQLKNEGTIKFTGEKSIGIQIYAPRAPATQIVGLNDSNGRITVGGIESYGMKLSSRVKEINQFENKGIISVSGGDETVESLSAGMAVMEDSTMSWNGSIRAYNDKVKNILEGIINVSGGTGNTGIYLKTKASDDIRNYGIINVTGRNNSGLRVDYGETSTDADGEPQAINEATGKININGTGNFGMIAAGSDNSDGAQAVNNGEIIIKNLDSASGTYLDSSVGMLAVRSQVPDSNGGYIENTGKIFIDNDVKKSQGMAIMSKSTGKNTGKIIIKGSQNDLSEGSVGIYNEGIFDMTGGLIEVAVNKGIGIYAKNRSATTRISGGTIEVSEGAIGLYADDKGDLDNGATIELSGSAELIVKSKGLMMYNYSSGVTGNPVGKFDVTGTINATIDPQGTAFYFKGIPDNVGDFLTEMVTGTGKLNIKLTDPTSSLFVLDNPGGIINLSDATMAGIIDNLPSTVIIDAGSNPNFKPYSVFKGALNINQNVNIDDSTDAYNRSEFISSKVNLLAGQVMTSTGTGKYAIGQENFDNNGVLNREAIVVTVDNGGLINMSGSESAGIIINYGEAVNNGQISMTGNKSIGIVSYNGSLTQNKGIIKVGEEGTGIYGENKRQSYGNGKIEIENHGLITTTAGIITNRSYGIFASNTESALSRADSTIKLFSGSEINMSQQNNGVGVSAKKSVITSDGKITVGEKGIAVYAEDTEVNINSGEINLNGNNAVGFHLKDSVFNGNSGVINVNGQNAVLFNLDNSTFTNNLTINATPGSSYVVGNITSGLYTYSGNNTLQHSNSLLLNGKGSAILLDSNSSVASLETGVVAVSVDGVYSSPPLPSPYTVEAENKGIINLGSSSAGIYGRNGARIKNSGLITLGSGSVGLYATGTGSESENTGIIELGNNSTGMYQENGNDLQNNNKITSLSSGTVGIYTKNNTGSINNGGIIELSGDKSIGIYAGGGMQNINNTGIIKVGDSASMNDPGIGIYTNNLSDTITNTGIIETGIKSLGIYSMGTIVDHNNGGVIKVGNEGTGIYKDGGILNINSGSKISVNSGEAVGIYGINSSSININSGAVIEINSGSYGAIVESGSNLNNYTTINLGDNSIFTYGNGSGTVTNNGQVNISGSDNTVFYMVKAGNMVNNSNITVLSGTGNIGIYNRGIYTTENIRPDGTIELKDLVTEGSIINNADISMGDSFLITNSHGIKTGYSVGIYAEGARVENSSGKTITIGSEGVGMYVRDTRTTSYNYGTIRGTGNKAIGIFADKTRVENHGLIELNGDGVIGMAGRNGAYIYNAANGVIKVTGKNVTGIYLSGENTKVENKGQIIITNTGDLIDDQGVGIRYTENFNENHIIGGSGDISGTPGGYLTAGSTAQSYQLPELPTLINSGQITIDVDSRFSYDGIKVVVKLDPVLDKAITDSSDIIGFSGTTLPEKLEIAPDFTQGRSADRFTFKNIFRGMDGTGEYISQSLTWDATGQGSDIVMTRKAYTKFTDGLWYEDFGRVLNERYANSTGDRMRIYNKIDMIQTEPNFRHSIASLAGNVYANINHREEDMARVLENSLQILENSSNNTKENVKINIIAGKGKTEEDTDGVVPYKYTSTGVQALREVERTYRHTFGYSLGYLHTGFEFEDNNSSEEWADTIQLGLHNKYRLNDWKLKNDLTGRVSFHNVDRNIDWADQKNGTERSEMNGTYETYSITSDNVLGREISLGKKVSITPYGALRAMYVTRPTFSESGLERLEIEGNDAWSVKPRAGVELKASVPLGKNTAWELKGMLDLAYEYELSGLDEREKAKLIAVEDGYHKLSKPEDEKGAFRTKASIGVEAEERYGVFLTGEYMAGNGDQDDYRAGVTLKAVF